MIGFATIRPDEWDVPLFLHVLGALTLIGALALTMALLVPAGRDGSAASLRLALRSLTLAVLPAWVVLRVSAEWIADKEGWNDVDDPPDWIGIGHIAGDAGLLLIVVSGLLGWFALRRARNNGDGDRPVTGVRVAAVLIGLLLVLNLVALWAMTTKPG